MSLSNLLNRLLGFSNGPDKSLISLVLLMRGPRKLKDEFISASAQKAWDGHLLEGRRLLVAGGEPSFIISAGSRSFVVNTYSSPYVRSPEKTAKSIPEPWIREAFVKHGAWLSVELLRPENPEGVEFIECMQMMGRLTAELANDNCLVVLSPQMNQMRVYEPGIRERLAGENPFDALKSTEPPLPEGSQDPKMREAVTEARRRWPEFAAAFSRRQHGQLFSARAALSDGKNWEWLWIRVTAIEGNVVTGKLDHKPGSITTMQGGDRVSVDASEIGDWMYVENGQIIGRFTTRPVTEPHLPYR